MSGPIGRPLLLQGLASHLADSLGVDAGNEEEMRGVRLMAEAAAGYFSGAAAGGPAAAGTVLTWAIYSALWAGKVPEAEINQFFASVNTDPARLFGAWRRLEAESPGGSYTVAIVPGKLSEADILKVTEALYLQMPKGG